MIMPLNKQQGNMYDWITHTWTVLQGECPHGCDYCSTDKMPWPHLKEVYTGPPRLNEDDMTTDLGSGKTIFVASTRDLFAKGVPQELTRRVLERCRLFPENTYVFQSKDPGRMFMFKSLFPPKVIMGTTLESNRASKVSRAPNPVKRARDFATTVHYWRIAAGGSLQFFVTIEPIMEFDLIPFLDLIDSIGPKWVNIGADSKGSGLPEPEPRKLKQLIAELEVRDIEVRLKDNLGRLQK